MKYKIKINREYFEDYLTFGDPQGCMAGGFGAADVVDPATVYDHQKYIKHWENWGISSRVKIMMVDLDMSEELDELLLI